MKEVSVTEVPEGAQLIDVRELDEWNEVHAQGAHHIPLGELEDRLTSIDGSRDVYVICKAGGRSARAVALLAEGGIAAINVAGGTDAWVAEGLPVEHPSA